MKTSFACFLAVLCIGCSSNKELGLSDPKCETVGVISSTYNRKNDMEGITLWTVRHDGHLFICSSSSYPVFFHHPDCPCLKGQYEKNEP